MAQPATSTPAIATDDWLPLDEAADLIGLSLRNLQHRCKTHYTPRGLAQKRRTRDGLGPPVWWVHRSIHAALGPNLNRGTRNDTARSALLENHAAHQVDKAYRKAHWLGEWRRLCSADTRPARLVAADVVADAKRMEPQPFSISVRSLQAWDQAYNALGPDGQIRGIAALVNHHTGPYASPPGPQASACADTRQDVTCPASTRSPGAIDYFYGLYHTQSGNKIITCHEAVVVAARREGWSWPDSYSATVKWLAAHDRRDTTCLHKDPKRYRHKFMPHIERDWTAIPPGHTFILDHAQLDLWCESDGQQFRPWLTGAIDGRSRCLVGWHIGDAPHTDAIMHALRPAFRDWCIPQRAYIDHGKDFSSELFFGATKKDRQKLRRQHGPDWRNIIKHNREVFFSGIFGELGIDITEAIPYQPWSKALIERFFGRVHDRFDRTFSTYCGKDTLARPECLEQIKRGYTDAEKRHLKQRYGNDWKRHAVLKVVDTKDIPTLDQVRNEFKDHLLVYHNKSHGGAGMNGDSPLAVWNTAQSLRQAGQDELTALMQARGVYRVGGNGVSFLVGAARLSYGASSVALRRFVGRDVFITLDPADCSVCQAYTADPNQRVAIGRLEANDRVPADTPVDQLREAIRNIQGRRRVMRRAAAEAPQRTRNAAAELRSLRAEKAAALRATGTHDRAPDANIVPVRTGFEGVSVPDRTRPTAAYEPAAPQELECLYADEESIEVGDDDGEGVEILFDKEESVEADDSDGIETLLDDEPAMDGDDVGLEALL